MKIRLDRTVCDGFGICAKHAPDYFSLDDWGYASLIGDGTVAEEDRDAVMRALMDCPVHAIIEMGEHRPSDDGASPTRDARRRAGPRRPKTTKRFGVSSVDQAAATGHRRERVLLDLGRRRHAAHPGVPGLPGADPSARTGVPVLPQPQHGRARSSPARRRCRPSPSTTASASPTCRRPMWSHRSRSRRIRGFG